MSAKFHVDGRRAGELWATIATFHDMGAACAFADLVCRRPHISKAGVEAPLWPSVRVSRRGQSVYEPAQSKATP